MNEKKEIKKKRVENFFINLTKEMILKNGIENVSVRKVADEASYTVATIYNYFGSFDTLLERTRNSIIDDLAEYLMKCVDGMGDKKSINGFYKSYIDYYLDNPHIYQFLFQYHIKKANKFEASDSVEKLWSQFAMLFEEFNKLGFDFGMIRKIADTILFSIHGMLTIHLSDNFALSKEQIYEGLNSVISITMKGEK